MARVLERRTRTTEIEMDHQTLVAKLNQIEEQAMLTLQSQILIKERQRMIIQLVRYLRSADYPREGDGALGTAP
jgi:hypothetical protein